jgi:hypothetical protein
VVERDELGRCLRLQLGEERRQQVDDGFLPLEAAGAERVDDAAADLGSML